MSNELAVLGADTLNQQAGGPSFFDTAAAFTSSAVVSGFTGIYNTFVDYGNSVGADLERLDTARILENYDRESYNYYKDNKQLVDTAGFIASSFLPGTLAIKALKVAQGATAAGAVGRAVTGPLNFFNAKRDAALAAGLQEIAREGGSAYAYINANKLAAIGWGFAEQALQASTFEAAVLLTMKQSPVLADAGTAEVLSDIAMGALTGGVFGGAIDAVFTNRVFKDATKAIAGKVRQYDTPAHFDKLGLMGGDEVYGFVDSLLKLPKEVLESDKTVTFLNTLSKKETTLDISKLLKTQLSEQDGILIDHIKTSMGKLGTEKTPETGQAMSAMILGIVRKGVAAGTNPAEIKQEVGSYLLGLKKVRTLTDDTVESFKKDDLFYINHEVDLKNLPQNATIDDFLNAARSRTPFEKNATAKPYELVGDPASAKVSLTATDFKSGFAAGNDIVVIGGKMRINPKSELFRQVTDPTLVPSRYINTKTGGVADEVVPTWADMLAPGAKAADSIVDTGVLNGKKVFAVGEMSPDEIVSAYTATARHAWAGTLSPKSFNGKIIEASDISQLERLRSLPKEQFPENVRVRAADGTIDRISPLDLKLTGSGKSIEQLLVEAKLQKTQELLDAGVTDMREVAYIVNADGAWIERALANGFTRTADDPLLEGMSRELTDYLSRENFIATWASPRSLVEIPVQPLTGTGTALSAETLAATEAAAASKGAKYLDSFVTGELGFQQRVALSEDARKTAFASVFGGEEAGRFMEVNGDIIKMADELGVGSGMLSSSNASYGDKLKLWAQHSGMLTHQLIQKVANVNLERIQPFRAVFADNAKAGAELGIITNMLRRTPHKFVIANDAQGIERLAVREVTKVDPKSGITRIIPEKLDEWTKAHATTGKDGGAEQAVFGVENPETLQFLKVWKDINSDRINKRAVLMNSRGGTIGWDPNVVYPPPIDTQKYPYFAFVKIREGHIAGNSDVGMITARTQEELNKLIKGVEELDQYDVFTKNQTERYFKVKNEYDAQLALNEPRVDSNLRSKKKLGDVFYEVRPENVLEDYARYSQNADAALVRHGVDTRYAQLITELNALGKKYSDLATSQFSGGAKLYEKSAINPFGDYVRTALDISKRSSFPLVNQLNEFVDSVGTTAYRILVANTEAAKKGLIPWEEAERMATKYGIGGMYTPENVAEVYGVANRPADRNLIRQAVSKVNMFLATAGLRLDFANSLVNIISMPIMLGTELASLKSLARKDPEALGQLSALLTSNIDGIPAPSMLKLTGAAISNVLGKDGKKLIEGYRASGDVKNIVLQFHEMMDDLAFKPALGPKKWTEAVSAWVSDAAAKGSKWTGNDFAEDFTRALSANVMDQLTAPLVARKLLTSQEAAAYRSVFVNRVNGNYIASQRPILFQGTVGAAVSLFQTYIFNVMQQMTRHVENRDTRALMTMVGLQGSIYGLNGIPFFEAVNTHLIGNASINDGHRDIYSATTQLAGKELGWWMLYGTASAFPLFGDKAPALYTRGDINPRHVSILPVSPLDIPAVEVSRRMVTNVWDVGSKIVAGANLSSALLEGLEHNGISRPLAGLAQLASGYTTTSKGSLISANNELSLTVAATRMLGAKPMDEAVALNTRYRQQAYRAADNERLSKLGEVVKTHLRRNEMPPDEELQKFMTDYARAGGNLQNYSSAMQRWSRDANMSVVNQMKAFHNTPYAQRMSEVMSGVVLDDFTTQPAPSEGQ